jgi:hypothetical protein
MESVRRGVNGKRLFTADFKREQISRLTRGGSDSGGVEPGTPGLAGLGAAVETSAGGRGPGRRHRE